MILGAKPASGPPSGQQRQRHAHRQQCLGQRTLTLISGNDTNIKGAQLAGNQVLASIGHHLNIVSDQDTDDYASKSMQAGGKVMVGITQSGFVSGSAYLSQGKVDSHYQSVNEVSGIQAGDGGFGIVVGNHTGLVGGQIASTADPSKNLLSTGSLSYADLTNQSKYNASQTSISGGSTLSSNVMGALGTGLSLATPQHENDTATRRAGYARAGSADDRLRHSAPPAAHRTPPRMASTSTRSLRIG